MKDVINHLYDTLGKNGWTLLRQSIYPHILPECINTRYRNPPSEWVEFINSIAECVNPSETVWFLCMNDYNRECDDGFRWNEFEHISSQAATEENDAEWQSSIVKFWDSHLPVCVSVAAGYEYYAIRMSDGVIVHGIEPEFEETKVVAPSFARFLEMVCAGECILE